MSTRRALGSTSQSFASGPTRGAAWSRRASITIATRESTDNGDSRNDATTACTPPRLAISRSIRSRVLATSTIRSRRTNHDRRSRRGRAVRGLHTHRALRGRADTIGASVVLGERRPFVVRHRAPLSEVVEKVPAGADPADVVFHPGEGDMLVMGGAFQRDWLHGVP